MNILVIGGQLQGTEITYLAKRAGWHVTLVDKRKDVLASRLCDEMHVADVRAIFPAFLAGYDLVVPATENLDTLCTIKGICAQAGVPFAFDERAYRLSSSKSATNAFLLEQGIAIPPAYAEAPDWVDGYLVKPDSESGSVGVRRFGRFDDANAFLEQNPGFVGQAFLDGPIYSVEVVCNGESVCSYCITEVVVGDDFDCHRIVAPALISRDTAAKIEELAWRLGRALDMRGIFDIEMIMLDGMPRVLEIDARMPSQTPIAIYHATGVNLLVELANSFVDGARTTAEENTESKGCAILQHVCVLEVAGGNKVSKIGEKGLTKAPPLEYGPCRYGADSTLFSYDAASKMLYATLIVEADEAHVAQERMDDALRIITKGAFINDVA